MNYRINVWVETGNYSQTLAICVDQQTGSMMQDLTRQHYPILPESLSQSQCQSLVSVPHADNEQHANTYTAVTSTDPACDASAVPGSSNHGDQRRYDVKGSTNPGAEEVLHRRRNVVKRGETMHTCASGRCNTTRRGLTLQTQLTTWICLSKSIMKMQKKTMAKTISQMATAE